VCYIVPSKTWNMYKYDKCKLLSFPRIIRILCMDCSFDMLPLTPHSYACYGIVNVTRKSLICNSKVQNLLLKRISGISDMSAILELYQSV
jgi:hypothetical protein